jgi:SAM-dependent methyltransferase
MFWIIFIIIFLLLASTAYAASRGAPWVPTWKRDLRRIEKLAHLKKGERFIELGCGTGRVCRHLAKHTEAETFGIELSFLQWLVAYLLSLRWKTIEIFLGDVFNHNLSSYDVVYMFLMPETYKKLRDKLTTELQPGSRVITYVWPIPDWTPSYVDRVEGAPDIYLYIRK